MDPSIKYWDDIVEATGITKTHWDDKIKATVVTLYGMASNNFAGIVKSWY